LGPQTISTILVWTRLLKHSNFTKGKKMTNTKEIMDFNNEDFDRFTYLLTDELLCRKSGYKATRAILRRMNNIDIDETLKFFESQGGYSDVGVMINVYGKFMDANAEVYGEVEGEVNS
jgi:hypothetical protein